MSKPSPGRDAFPRLVGAGRASAVWTTGCVVAGAPGSQTDTIGFYFADGSTSGFPDAAWSRLFGDRAPLGTGFLTSSEWTPGIDATFTLDLAVLPLDGGGTIDLIPMLNSNGFVDVFVGDESGTDYFQLTLVIPEPSTLPLLSLGLSALAAKRRRVRQHRLRRDCFDTPARPLRILQTAIRFSSVRSTTRISTQHRVWDSFWAAGAAGARVFGNYDGAPGVEHSASAGRPFRVPHTPDWSSRVASTW